MTGDNKQRPTDRRTVLKSKAEDCTPGVNRRKYLAGIGGGIFGLSLFSSVTTASDEMVSYVSAYRHKNHEEVKEGEPPKREPVWKKMPQNKWIRIKSANDALRKIDGLIRKTTDSPLIQPGVTTKSPNGEKIIEVDYVTLKQEDGNNKNPDISFDDLKQILPEQISGEEMNEKRTYDVTTRKITHHKTTSCKKFWFNDNYAHDMPGGAKIDVGCGPCTFGVPAHIDDGGERVMLTAGHCVHNAYLYSLFQPSCSQGHIDGDDGKYFNNSYKDYGYVTSIPSHPHTGSDIYEYKLAADSGYRNGVVMGIKTWTETERLENDSVYVNKQGARTGNTVGYIDKTVIVNGHRTVYVTNDGWAGDSGGPIYKEESTALGPEYYLIAINHSRTSGSQCGDNNKSIGNAAEDIEGNLFVTI